jgi:hypothetical protein
MSTTDGDGYVNDKDGDEYVNDKDSNLIILL